MQIIKIDARLPLSNVVDKDLDNWCAEAEKHWHEDKAFLENDEEKPAGYLSEEGRNDIPLYLRDGEYWAVRTNEHFYNWRYWTAEQLASWLPERLAQTVFEPSPELIAFLLSDESEYIEGTTQIISHMMRHQVYRINAVINGEPTKIKAHGLQFPWMLQSTFWLGFMNAWTQMVRHECSKFYYSQLEGMEDADARRAILNVDQQLRKYQVFEPSTTGYEALQKVNEIMKANLADRLQVERDYPVAAKQAKQQGTKEGKADIGNLATHFKSIVDYNRVIGILQAKLKINSATARPHAWLDTDGDNWKQRLNHLLYYLISSGYLKESYIAPSVRKKIIQETFGVNLHVNTCKAERDPSLVKYWERFIPEQARQT